MSAADRIRSQLPQPVSDFVAFAHAEIAQSIPARFAAIVARHPRRIAVDGRDGRLTYAELDARSGRLASAIRRRRAGPGAPVAVVMPQGASAVVAILGVLRTGACYLPLDPRWPETQRRAMLARCTPDLVLVSASTAADHGGYADVLGIEEALAEADAPLPPPSVAADDLAYVFFTSGTSGAPKGVMDTHRHVLHNVMRYTNALAIAPGDRLTLLQSVGFSGSVSSLFCALLNGACVLPLDIDAETPASIARWLRECRATIYHSVPSLFRALAAGDDGRGFPDLRVVRLEGDQASAAEVDLFRRCCPSDSALVHGLGATETGIVSQLVVTHASPPVTGVLPVGHACADVEIRIVGDGGEVLPAETAGEIEVVSRYLAYGLWGEPEMTARVFRAGADGTRAYRTGDRGRLRPDGCLEHLGRLDGRLRLRGAWVERAEVEAALARVPGVGAAAVGVHERRGEPRLVAYVVPATPARADASRAGVPTPSALRRALAAEFPRHAVPSAYVVLPALPVTANGKLDRGALPPPDGRRPALDTPYVAPRSLLQRRLADLWTELLGVAPIGIDDDFFDLGGDSMLAVMMIDRVCALVDDLVPAETLLGGTTIAALDVALAALQNRLGAGLVALQTAGTRPALFFLHGGYLSGGVYCLELARLLGADQPFYALAPLGLDGGPVPATYAAMAARHLRSIRQVQPHGPYCLAGTCNGGLAAYEVARRLAAAGERVAFLGLIHASGAGLRPAPIDRFLRASGARLGLGGATLHALLRRVAPAALARRRVVPSRRDADRARLRAHYLRADALYVPGPYAGPVTLLWPADAPGESADDVVAWWRQVASEVTLRSIPGDGSTCLTRHLSDLAAALVDGLHAAESGMRA